MGTSEENRERFRAMKRENERRREELAFERPEREEIDPLAEAMRQPVEDDLARWRRDQMEAEQRRADARRERQERSVERRLASRVAEAVLTRARAEAAELVDASRAIMIEAVGETLGQMRADAKDQLHDEVKALRLELAALQDTLDELRRVVGGDGGGKVLDMPNFLRTRAN